MIDILIFLYNNLETTQLTIDIFKLIMGLAFLICPLKWQKILLTTMSAYWGTVVSILIGLVMETIFKLDASVGLYLILIGLVIFPIMVYKISAATRFALGFVTVIKPVYMYCAILSASKNLDLLISIYLPILAGVIIGLVYMAMKELDIRFYLFSGCFIGASQTICVFMQYIGLKFKMQGAFYFPISMYFTAIEIIYYIVLIVIIMSMGILIQLKTLKEQRYTDKTLISDIANRK